LSIAINRDRKEFGNVHNPAVAALSYEVLNAHVFSHRSGRMLIRIAGEAEIFRNNFDGMNIFALVLSSHRGKSLCA
jgi:hypothetical protein